MSKRIEIGIKFGDLEFTEVNFIPLGIKDEERVKSLRQVQNGTYLYRIYRCGSVEIISRRGEYKIFQEIRVELIPFPA